MAQFSILTLNLRHGQGPRVPGERKHWSFWRGAEMMRRNAAAIGDFIRQMAPQPDIVCLQETNAIAFFWPDVAEIVREHIGYPYGATASARVLPHNNAIVSRFPLSRVVSRQFRKLPAIAAGWQGVYYSMNRGFIAAEIEGVGFVVSTHLDPYIPALRFRQARELRQALSARGGILAGDFNPGAWNEESLKVIGEGFATSPPIDGEYFVSFATWPAGRLERASPGAGAVSSKIAPEHRLDYVFVAPEFQVVSAERILTGHTDHYGVVVTVERRSP